MKCEKVEELLLTGYMDGELPVQEKQALERHLAGCVSCREFLRQSSAVKGAAAGKGYVQPPAEVWEAIRERLDRVPWWKRVWVQPPLPAFAMSMAVVALVITAVLVRPGGDPVRFSPVAESEEAALFSDLAQYASETDFGTSLEEYFL